VNKAFNVDGSGKDGGVVYWEPEEMRSADLIAALKGVSLEDLAPKHSVKAAALQDAFMTFIEKAKLKVRGKPIKTFRLSADVTGLDARQINPGNEDVDPVFVASVVVDANGQVRIPKHNSSLLPQLDNHKAQVEAVMQKVFDHRCNYFPTAMVSGCVAKVISALGGILVRQTGGLYFLPEKGLERFDQFAKSVNAVSGGPELVMVRFPVVPTETSYAAVMKAVKKIAKDRMKAVEESIHELGSTKKQRANGTATRLKECQDVLDLLNDYSEILGVDLVESKEIVKKVKDAVNAHAALEWCS
jgi:hypothetical protein